MEPRADLSGVIAVMVAARHVSARVVYSAIEDIWLLGFAIAGRFRRPSVRRWQPVGGETVMVLAPHPDDEAIGCGGTLLLHRAYNDRVVVIYITDGGQSKVQGLAPDAVAAVRAGEAHRAARSLGVEAVYLGLPEGIWRERDLVDTLRELLRTEGPAIVYALWPVDYHPDHRRVGRALAAALQLDDALTIRLYQVQVPLTCRLTNLVAVVRAVGQAREAALRTYESQTGTIKVTDRLHRYVSAFWGEPVECFCELAPAQYLRLMEMEWETPVPVRALRSRPVTDPLGFFIGIRGRRRLAAGMRAMQSRNEKSG